MKYIVLILMVIFLGLKVKGKDSTLFVVEKLISIDTLLKALGQYHKEVAVYEIEKYTYIEKWKWLQYAPSFGWNFIQNSPYIGYNSSQLFNALNFKRKKQAQINSIINQINLNFRKNSIKLKLIEGNYRKKTAIFNHVKKMMRLEKEHFTLRGQQYNKKEITPSQWIQEQLRFESKVLNLMNLKFELEEIRNDIITLAYYGVQEEPLIKNLEDVTSN
jgi:hypothetical protein